MNAEISLENKITGQLFKAIYDFINFIYILHYFLYTVKPVYQTFNTGVSDKE